MANKQKPPSSRTMGSQKNHKADPAWKRNPEKKMLRVLQSSGLKMAQAYAEHFGIQQELKKDYFIQAVERISRRKEDRRSGLQTQSAPETQPQAE